MPAKKNRLYSTLAYWSWLRLIELIVFLIVFVVSAELIDNFRSGGVIYSFQIALGVSIFYGIFMLYWPLSFGITAWLKPRLRWFPLAELLFFISHSFLALSIVNNAAFGVSERIVYVSPEVLGWGSVCVAKAMLIAISAIRTD